MATTRLGPSATPWAPLGSFAGKEQAAVPEPPYGANVGMGDTASASIGRAASASVTIGISE